MTKTYRYEIAKRNSNYQAKEMSVLNITVPRYDCQVHFEEIIYITKKRLENSLR